MGYQIFRAVVNSVANRKACVDVQFNPSTLVGVLTETEESWLLSLKRGAHMSLYFKMQGSSKSSLLSHREHFVNRLPVCISVYLKKANKGIDICTASFPLQTELLFVPVTDKMR